MNKTVELVNLWGKFEESHPGASIDDFCRHLLISKRENLLAKRPTANNMPIHVDGFLMRTISKITKMNMMYANMAFEGTGLNQVEEFGMLLTIQNQKNPRKTEVIYDNLMELSSGTDMVNRLIKRGFITEHNDKEDKRAKRLKMTASGEKTFLKCLGQIGKTAKMMLMDMDDEDKELCLQLLKDVEAKFLVRWQQDRAKPFEEVFGEVKAGKKE